MMFVYVCVIFVAKIPLSQFTSDFIRPQNIRGFPIFGHASYAIGVCSTACNCVNFVSIVMKIIDNMQNIVVKYLPEFGIDCMRSFCIAMSTGLSFLQAWSGALVIRFLAEIN